MSDQMQRLGDFLEFFAPQSAYWETADQLGLQHERYEWPEPSAELSARLRHLQQLNQSLDERLPPEPQFPAGLAIDYAAELNPRQQAAVACTQGPLLVIAGAGSGKTRTLVYRLSYLLEQGVPAQRILLLTFTRRAAQQMLERAQLLRVGSGAQDVMGGTFHSFCAWILRRLAPLAELNPHFSIIDTVDACDIIDLICNELKLRGKDRAFPRKARIQDILSKARNVQLALPLLLERDYPELLDYLPALELIASTYSSYKRGNHLMDYDDLLEVTRDLLRHNVRFARKARSFFDHVMVDEYQDTNLIQKDLADALAQEHGNLMVVGDDAQSIYGFRGADYENILRFPETWPTCRLVRLEQNYRSTPSILNFTNQILSHNPLGFAKSLFSDRAGSHAGAWPLPQLERHLDAGAEAEAIADKILELHHQGQLAFCELAVLYRAGFHSTYLQAELLKRRIPFVVYGGIRFIERRHIKDMLAYLRIALNPFDAIAWHRILALLPGVGQVSARKIIEHIRQHHGELVPTAFGKKSFAQALAELQQLLTQVRQASHPATQMELVRQYYIPLLRSVESDHLQRLPDLEVLLDLAGKYEQLERFLTDFTLDPPAKQFQNQSTPSLAEDEKPLVLSTVHSAKGLEWRVVFVLHLLDGLLPSKRTLQDFAELAEERRLFYVACSRAMDQLYLSLPASHYSYSDSFYQPSRFLSEISPDAYAVIQTQG